MLISGLFPDYFRIIDHVPSGLWTFAHWLRNVLSVISSSNLPKDFLYHDKNFIYDFAANEVCTIVSALSNDRASLATMCNADSEARPSGSAKH
jgi:hypothetical protein